jgi:hypothetical protein
LKDGLVPDEIAGNDLASSVPFCPEQVAPEAREQALFKGLSGKPSFD